MEPPRKSKQTRLRTIGNQQSLLKMKIIEIVAKAMEIGKLNKNYAKATKAMQKQLKSMKINEK